MLKMSFEIEIEKEECKGINKIDMRRKRITMSQKVVEEVVEVFTCKSAKMAMG